MGEMVTILENSTGAPSSFSFLFFFFFLLQQEVVQMEANGREEEKGVGSRGRGGKGESCPRLLQAHQLSLSSPLLLLYGR